MPRVASARRYAQAAFQLATERGEHEVWLDDLMLLTSALEGPEFARFLDAPQVPVSQKVQLIRNALGDSVSPLALNLLSLLASRGIAHLMLRIVEQYQRLLDTHQGIERAEVVSAVALDGAQRQRIGELLKEMVGKDVRLTSRAEPQILGGFVARVGDRVIDGSARTKLRRMESELAGRLS